MRAKKTYSQNFLQDKRVVQKIIAAAEIVPGETVLEIGPGTGILTHALVQAGARMVAVEADRDMVEILREKFGETIELIEGDILGLDTGAKLLSGKDRSFASAYKIVANLPYSITSAILEKFLTAEHPPTRMVLMVQREVADRIVAKPPDMSLLSVVCQLYAACRKIANVPAGAFRPIPKVDSAVVRLDLRQPPSNLPLRKGEEDVIALAKAGFSSRRKQLHGNLARAGYASSDQIKAILEHLGLTPTVRAENLTVENWIGLHDLVYLSHSG